MNSVETAAGSRLMHTKNCPSFMQAQIIEIVEFDKQAILVSQIPDRTEESILHFDLGQLIPDRFLRIPTRTELQAGVFAGGIRQTFKLRVFLWLHKSRLFAVLINCQLSDDRPKPTGQ